MKLAKSNNSYRKRLVTFIFAAAMLLTSGIAVQTFAQAAEQLSLADVLIALRSKKATLAERNRILTEAVRQRGITFAVAPQIEKELSLAGADTALLNAIREKGAMIKISSIQAPPPDADYYQKRGNNNAAKGDFLAAVTDYNIAAELDPDEPSIYMDRGSTHFNLKEFAKAIVDYDKAIELDPALSKAYFNRALSREMTGDVKGALEDFKKTVELEPGNMAAKASVGRIEASLAPKTPKRVEKPVEKPVENTAAAQPTVPAETNTSKAEEPQNTEPETPVKTEPAVKPEKLNVGLLSAADARRMVTPIYSDLAQQNQISGKVTVEVELDEDGDVVSVDAIDGPKLLRNSAESAARRSKFNPVLWNGQPIRATGYIIYNFSLPGQKEE